MLLVSFMFKLLDIIPQYTSVEGMHTRLYFWSEGVFKGGPANGIDKLVSKNLSDNKPPITVPYLHFGNIILKKVQGMLNILQCKKNV